MEEGGGGGGGVILCQHSKLTSGLALHGIWSKYILWESTWNKQFLMLKT